VGVFRLLEALHARNIRPAVAIDALTAEMYPFLVRWLTDAGADFIGHGISVNRPLHGAMSASEERSYINETLERLAASGVETSGWLGPEYGESMHTPEALADAGISYVCDWCNDEQPYRMSGGGSLIAFPMLADLDDQTSLVNRMIELSAYERHLSRCVTALAREGANSGRVMAFAIRPWILGQPFRIGAFERFLDTAKEQAGVWFAGPTEIVSTWRSMVMPEVAND
jgi:hypothetical protein